VKSTAALAACALLVALAPIPGAAVERFYSNGIFPVLQRAITALSNLTPVALLDLAIVAAIAWWIGFFARDVARRPLLWRRVARRLALRTVAAVCLLYLAFVAIWGLNYRRISLVQKLPYDRAAVTPGAAREVAQRAVVEINARHAPAHAELDARAMDVRPSLAEGFARAQRMVGTARLARPARPKHSLLDAYFGAAGVDGMTDPFFLETLTAGGLLPFEEPIVVAHEWSHLAGFADEGEANFVGWLTCLKSDSEAARYSGWLFLYGEIVAALPAAERTAIAQGVADGPRRDLRAIADRVRRQVRPIVSSAGWRVYDRYLKANRVEAGAESYGQVVRLVLGTRGAGYF
jgi:hypothetical protein